MPILTQLRPWVKCDIHWHHLYEAHIRWTALRVNRGCAPCGLIWTSDQPDAETFTWQHTTLTWDRHLSPGGIRIRDSSKPQTDALNRAAPGSAVLWLETWKFAIDFAERRHLYTYNLRRPLRNWKVTGFEPLTYYSFSTGTWIYFHTLVFYIYHPTYALWDTPFRACANCYMFRHRGAILRESLQQKHTSQCANIGSAPAIGIAEILKF